MRNLALAVALLLLGCNETTVIVNGGDGGTGGGSGGAGGTVGSGGTAGGGGQAGAGGSAATGGAGGIGGIGGGAGGGTAGTGGMAGSGGTAGSGGCLSDADCDAATASRCDLDSNECGPCVSSADCDGVDGLDPTNNACDEGLCVDCTTETEATTCLNDVSCNPATRTCTETLVGSRDVCETCAADSECGNNGVPSDEHRCVPMVYQGSRFPDEETGFCLKTTAGGCGQPFSITLVDRSSLSEPAMQTNYCGINESLTTCPAVRALVANQTCPGGEDAECPSGGLCRDVGGLPDRCTYLCSDVVECKEAPVPGSTCESCGSGSGDCCGG